MDHRKDIAIIGGGPGGYLAALRAAQLGRKAVLFEEDRVGGTCMNYGCIPTKYLLHQTKVLKEVRETKTITGGAGVGLDWAAVQAGRQAVVDRLVRGIEFLLEKSGVEIVKGRARLEDAGRVVVETPDGPRTYHADAVILATGSRAAPLPFLAPNGAEVVTSTEALVFPEIPKSLLVIGAGAIGLEMGSIYRRLGTDVTILEILPGITPGSDRETAGRLAHTVKGVSGNLGAETLYRAAAELEKAIKEGRKNIDPPLTEFGSQLNIVMDGIKALEESLAGQKEPEPSTEVSLDKEAVKLLLQEMARLLESDLTEAMNRLEALRQHLKHSSAHEEFRKLEKYVDGFDTDSALKTVEAIARVLDIAFDGEQDG